MATGVGIALTRLVVVELIEYRRFTFRAPMARLELTSRSWWGYPRQPIGIPAPPDPILIFNAGSWKKEHQLVDSLSQS